MAGPSTDVAFDHECPVEDSPMSVSGPNSAETTGRGQGGVGRALVLSCHPLPTVAVTAISAGLAALAGLSIGRAALMVTAVFAGQLSIGWSNDAIDAARDRATRRSDKPVAQGAVSIRAVGVAAGLALRAAVVLSLALGWQPGLASLTVVACGWLYNLGLKETI